MRNHLDEALAVQATADCLYNHEQVETAIRQLAGDITEQLGETDPRVLCVMNGALVFAGQLLTRLRFPLTVDYIHATRYGPNTSGQSLEWVASPHLPLAGQTVLVLDDILDEGLTLAAIMDYCRQQGATAVYSAVLVEKQHARRDPAIQADFTALTVPDRYVFGYGMDYKGRLRNVAGIYAVAEDDTLAT